MKSFLLSALILFILPVSTIAQETSLPDASIRIQVRYELDEGAKNYQQRKFEQAEEHFRRALNIDSSDKTSRLFLVRALHQQYLSNRVANVGKGEEAIELYRKILADNFNDENSNRALANLLELIKGENARDEWLTTRGADERVNSENRSDALTSLAARKYNCVNDITEAAKKTIIKGESAIFVFKKPRDAAIFETARKCADEGFDLINKALELNQTNDSAWSYKASLLIQKARLAGMQGNVFDKERFRNEGEAAKEHFLDLSEKKMKKKVVEEQKSVNPQ